MSERDNLGALGAPAQGVPPTPRVGKRGSGGAQDLQQVGSAHLGAPAADPLGAGQRFDGGGGGRGGPGTWGRGFGVRTGSSSSGTSSPRAMAPRIRAPKRRSTFTVQPGTSSSL